MDINKAFDFVIDCLCNILTSKGNNYNCTEIFAHAQTLRRAQTYILHYYTMLLQFT